MAFAPVFQRPFPATFDRRAAVAAAAWWLEGGVAAANCLAAYQPKGAASLAASYDNIAAPGNGLADGTYDAALGTAPTHASATGWTFNGTTQYLTTGVTASADQTWSVLVRFTANVPSFAVLIDGRSTFDNRFSVFADFNNANHYYQSGTGSLGVVGAVSSGVLGFAGTTAYRDGASDGTIPTGSGQGTIIRIGAGANAVGALLYYFNGSIQAVAIYNTTLTAPQVASISAAMALL